MADGSPTIIELTEENDIFSFNGDNFVIKADEGDDEVTGIGNNNRLFGGEDNDKLIVEGNGNLLKGGEDNDILKAFGENNRLFGGEDNDKLIVEGNDNLLFGGEDNDTLMSSSSGGFFVVGSGNTLTGGEDIDTFDVTANRSDIVVNNNSGSSLDIVDAGDVIEGVFDTITDYQSGETIVANVSTQLTVVGLDGFFPGHQHLELMDGEYAFISGQSSGPGLFTVGAGSDTMVVFDTLDGTDEPFFQGAVVVLNADPNMINIV